MSNSIGKENLKKDNNSMLLSFHWKATFKDGSKIFQFDREGKEHLFKEVKEKINDLVTFSFYNKNTNKMFTVNLVSGTIYDNSNQEIIEELINNSSKKNIRLIAFRRNTQKFNMTNLQQLNHTIIYVLGLQYNDENNNNHKLIMQIDESGKWIISGE